MLHVLNRIFNNANINIFMLMSIRQSSNYKRRMQPATLLADKLAELKTTYFQGNTTLKSQDWRDLRQTLIDNYKHIDAHNVDAFILSLCHEPHNLLLAKDYVSHLYAIGQQPNAATLGRLLRIYNSAHHACGELGTAEQHEISEICEKLKSKQDLLDATTCECLIHGLVATKHWHESLKLLDMLKITATPSLGVYTELALKAFKESDFELGWKLLEEMLELRRHPRCELYNEYLKQITKMDDAKFISHFEKLLAILERHSVLITLNVAKTIESIARNKNLVVKVTKVTKLGKCNSCEQFLQHVTISDEEFKRMRDVFWDKVLVRNDVFQKSTPAEVTEFKRFVDTTAPYDCVIDGLNVAYSMGTKKPPEELAKLLATVVRYFKTQRKRVLVLGRKHMNKWSKPAMHYVHSNASVFLTNNLTHDDPFLLYATLKSGQATDFFSRDLMRTHAYLLGTDLKQIFRRWQQEHQYSLVTQTNSGKIIIKEPIRYRLAAHKVNDTWHVPCRAEYMALPQETLEEPEHWVCIIIK